MGRPLGSVLSMRLIIRPLAELLGRYIDRSGVGWQQTQRARQCEALVEPADVKPPSYRISEYVGLGLENACLAELQKLWWSDDWSWLPGSHRNLCHQTVLFNMCSRLGACLHELLMRPTKLFPMVLFSLRQTPEEVQQIQSQRQCVMDEFSKAFLAAFPGPTLTSPEALATLDLIAQVGYTDTVGVEWSHGSIQKLLSAQKQHSNVPSMRYINSQWVARKYGFREGQTPARLGVQTRRSPKRRVGAAAEVPSTKKRRKAPAGGALRAYVSRRARGQGRADFKRLAAEFRAEKAMNSEAYQLAKKEGAAATELNRITGTKQPFGLVSRALRRSQLAKTRLVLSSTSSASSSLHGSLLHTGHQGPLLTADLPTMRLELRRLRSHKLQAAKQRLAQKQEEVDTLQNYYDTHQASLVQDIVSMVPATAELPDLVNSMHPVPNRQFRCCEVAFQSLETAGKLAAWGQTHSRNSNFLTSLRKDWDSKNVVVLDKEVPKEWSKSGSKKQCAAVGVCICSTHGKMVKHLYAQFLRALKTDFPTGQPAGEKLTTGAVVVHLSCPALSESMMSPWAAALLQMVDEQDTEVVHTPEQGYWVHISLLYKKPYRPTFHRVEPVRELPQGRREVRTTNTFDNALDFFNSIRVDLTWQVQWYTQVTSPAPLPDIRPTCCCVEPWGNTHRLQPLDTQPRTRGRRRQAQAEDSQPSVDEADRHRGVDRRGEGAQGQPSLSEGEQDAGVHQGEEASDAGDVDEWDVDSESNGSALDLLASLEQILQESVAPEATDPLVAATNEVENLEEEVVQPLADASTAADPAAAALLEEGLEAGTGGPADTDTEVGVPAPAPMPAVPRGLPPLRRAEPVARARILADLTLEVPGGKLTYYARTQVCTATCSNDLHGRCVLTRTLVPGKPTQQGRPMGLLMAWLEMGQHVGTKAEHWDKDSWPTHQERLMARGFLSTLEGSEGFFDAEKPLAEGESEEPLLRP